MAVRSATGFYQVRVYYTNEIPDNGGLPGTSVLLGSSGMTFTIGDRNKELLEQELLRIRKIIRNQIQ